MMMVNCASQIVGPDGERVFDYFLFAAYPESVNTTNCLLGWGEGA